MSEERSPTRPEAELPRYVIEGARSSRSRCKTCRRVIGKGALRLGVLIDGPFGAGYLWHHLNCAARRHPRHIEEAYELEAWKEAKVPPPKVPTLDSLNRLRDSAEARRQRRRVIPYAELAPTGRSKCKHCGEPIEKQSLRVALGRLVEFGNQVRTSPIGVHPRCVAAQMKADDCATRPDGFAAALRANSTGLRPEQIDSVLSQIGPLET